MNSRFLNGLSDKDQKELIGQIKHTLLANRLRAYIQKQVDEISSCDRSTKQFENPNWAYEQAYRNGELTKLTEILKLIDG